MFEKIRNLFLYTGIDRFSYERVRDRILKTNRIFIIMLTSFSTILIAAMLIFSLNSEAVSQNRFVYQFGLVFSFLILILSITVANKHLWIITPLVYASCTIYYMYGILIGTITDPANKTVSFMVMLVFLPTLYICRPIHIISLSTTYIMIFEILCLMNKEGAVLSNDIADAIIFGVLGLASGTIVNYIKVRGYVMENKLHEISRIDQLTQVKNRNAYEIEYDSIPNKCKYTLGCLYIDANGLHELNNSKGHEYGDKMLKFIANEVKNTFSIEYTYRTGGDEFVVFIPDLPKEDLDCMIYDLVEKIETEGYHVATGYEVDKVKRLSLDKLIRTAERKMYQNKKEYYKGINREIRN